MADQHTPDTPIENSAPEQKAPEQTAAEQQEPAENPAAPAAPKKDYQADNAALPFVVLVLVVVGVYLLGLERRELWSSHEVENIGVILEVVRGGNTLVPELFGQRVLSHPPLYTWLSALIVGNLAQDLPSLRLLSGIAAALTVLLIYLTAVKLRFSGGAALLSGVILGTSLGFWFTGRQVMYDPLLVFWTTLAIYAGACAAGCECNGKKVPALFALAVAGGLLTGGLIGLSLPFIVLVSWFILTGHAAKARLWKMVIGGSLVALVPLVAWLFLVLGQVGSEGVWAFIGAQYQPFFGLEGGAGDPWYTTIVGMLLKFMPWTLLLPFAIMEVTKTIAAKTHAEQRSGVLLSLVWFAVPALILSFGAAQSPLSALPLLPGLALLTGYGLSSAWQLDRLNNWLAAIPTKLLAVLIIAAGTVYLGAAIYFHLPFILWPVVFFVIAIPGAYALQSFKSGRPGPGLLAATTGLVFAFFFTGLVGEPIYDGLHSHKNIITALKDGQEDGLVYAQFSPTTRQRVRASLALGQSLDVVSSFDDAREFLAADGNHRIVGLRSVVNDIPGTRREAFYDTGYGVMAIMVGNPDSVIEEAVGDGAEPSPEAATTETEVDEQAPHKEHEGQSDQDAHSSEEETDSGEAHSDDHMSEHDDHNDDSGHSEAHADGDHSEAHGDHGGENNGDHHSSGH